MHETDVETAGFIKAKDIYSHHLMKSLSCCCFVFVFLHVCWEEFLLLFTEDSGDEQEMWGEHVGE